MIMICTLLDVRIAIRQFSTCTLAGTLCRDKLMVLSGPGRRTGTDGDGDVLRCESRRESHQKELEVAFWKIVPIFSPCIQRKMCPLNSCKVWGWLTICER